MLYIPVEQRRTQRFTMQLPLAVTLAGAEQPSQSGYTRNISSAGVLFTSEEQPEPGDSIEYVITLHTGARQRVKLRCLGKVLRCEEEMASIAGRFQIAATLERYEFIRHS